MTRLPLAALVCCLGSLAGCDPQQEQPPPILPGGLEPANKPVPAESATPLAPVGGLEQVEPAPLVAAKKGDQYWTREEVETWLRQDLKLAQVSLSNGPDHGFSGNGVGFDGRQFTLTVKQVPGGIKCWFDDNVGGSGNMAFGKMAEEPKAFVPK